MTEARDTPFAVADLDGSLIGQAFLKLVISDPAVQAHRAAVIAEDHKWAKVFDRGIFPHWFPLYTWPIVISADELALLSIERPITWEPPGPPKYRFQKPADWRPSSAKPATPSPAIHAVSTIIAARSNWFVGLLARGEVTSIDMEGRKPGPGAWSRRGAEIEIRTSDYYLDYKQPLFRGLTLRVIERPAQVSRFALTSRVTRSNKPGRKDSYDWERLKDKLKEHCANHGRFDSEPELVTWCVKNTTLLPGRSRPKRAGERPDRKTVIAAIEKYGLKRIGLTEGCAQEKGK